MAKDPPILDYSQGSRIPRKAASAETWRTLRDVVIVLLLYVAVAIAMCWLVHYVMSLVWRWP